MGKKFISVKTRNSIHRLHESDIKKIFYFKTKRVPNIPSYGFDNNLKLDESTPSIFLEEKVWKIYFSLNLIDSIYLMLILPFFDFILEELEVFM